MKHIFSSVIFSACLFFGLFVFSGASKADLTITPTRIVFLDRDRFATVTLVNTGKDAKTYEMGWDFLKMQEEGPAYQTLDKAFTEFDLSQYIVFSPKRVTLEPGAKQKVRLALRRPESIPLGDYHIHLRFSGLGNKPVVQKPDDPSAAKKKSAMVDINVGYSIPVILRVGKEDVKAKIEQISVERNKTSGRLDVSVPVARSGGAYSILGHLFIYHIGADGKEERVGEVSNAHIFSEVNRRVFVVPLVKDVVGGSLKIVMKNYDLNSGMVYAQEVFPIN